MNRFKSVMILLSIMVLFVVIAANSNAIVEASQQHPETPTFTCADVTEIPQTECEALVALYNATDGDNWTDNTGWLITNTPCSWHGVSCYNGSVYELNLSSKNLSGVVPPEIGNLTNLMTLYLGSNQLTVVPPEIGNLTNLTYLDLGGNQLTAVPPEIGNLTNLTSLYLFYNQLTALPPEIGNLTNLSYLHLGDNQLTAIPPEIGNLANLTSLNLWDNQLTAVPSEIGNLTNLTDLYLLNNQLTAVPPEIGNLANLIDLHLEGNQLAAVPPEIWNLTNLTYLSLQGNQLTAVPPEIGNLTNLIGLYLFYNQLTAVPPEIGNLTNLTTLYLSGNQLAAMPPEIGDLTNLTTLYLWSNQLTAVPSEIGNLTNLRTLGLDSNQLMAVPPEIGNLTNLTTLYLSRNQLTAVPPEIGDLTNLRTLDLSRNQLTAVPSEIGNLINLTDLDLYDNHSLAGELPQSLTLLTNLSLFTFWGTAWCIPNDSGIQNWLDNIYRVYGTGLICNQPTGGITGQLTGTDGQPLGNAQVVLYRTLPAVWSYHIFVDNTYTDETGQYIFSNLGQGINYKIEFQDTTGTLAPQYYDGKGTLDTADPITITLGMTRTINAQLDVPQPPLVTVGLGNSGVTTSTNPVNGAVLINVPNGQATDLTLTYAASCEGGSTPSAVVLTYNNQAYAMSVNAGLYHVTIPASDVVASGDITIATTCNGTDNTVTVGQVTLFDPSGLITDAQTDQPVEGARVTLYQVPGWLPRTSPADTRPNTCESNDSKAEGAPWSQPAPTEEGIIVNTDLTTVAPLISHQYTNDVGYYGWDVPEGCWYVVVEAEGYETLTSPVVGIPPEVVDLDLALMPTGSSDSFVYLPMVVR